MHKTISTQEQLEKVDSNINQNKYRLISRRLRAILTKWPAGEHKGCSTQTTFSKEGEQIKQLL